METFKGILNSGLKYEIGEMKGKHQRILSSSFAKDEGLTGLNEVLADILVSLGDKKNITVADIKHLLSCDKENMLLAARNLSMDGEPFEFTYKYKSKSGIEKEVALVYDFEKDGDLGITTVKVEKEVTEGKFTTTKLADANFENGYTDEDKIVTIMLPKSKKVVKFRMLDGRGEENGAKVKVSQRTSHTPLKMRNPVEVLDKKDKEGNNIEVILNLDDLGLKDISYLRAQIKAYEGRVDTEIKFEHPEKENEFITVNILGQLAFFFPSEEI